MHLVGVKLVISHKIIIHQTTNIIYYITTITT